MVNNGFGRSGGMILKNAIKRGAIVVAENYPVIPINYMVYMFKYDSVNGNIKNEVCENEQSLYVNGNKITVFDGRDPANINWSSAGAKYVVRSTEVVAITDRAFARTKERAKDEDISAPSAVAPMFCDGNQPFDAKAEIQLSKTFVKLISGFENKMGYFNRARITPDMIWTQCAIIKVVLTRVKPPRRVSNISENISMNIFQKMCLLNQTQNIID